MIKTITISEYLTLKQIELTDNNDIFNIIDSQRDYLGQWLPFVKTTLKPKDTEEFIKSVIDSPRDSFNDVFVIRYNNETVGLIGFKGTDYTNQRTELGYWLSKHFQKKGIMIRSVTALCQFAFEELDMNRIQIKVAIGNLPSKKIPVNLNFQFEGIERQGEKMIDGSFADIEVFSLLKREFENEKEYL